VDTRRRQVRLPVSGAQCSEARLISVAQ
jgi:hypothetical protein